MPDIFKASPTPAHPVKKHESVTPRVAVPENIHPPPKYSHSPFAAFSYFPKKVKFVAKEQSEEIILLLRRHPITNIPWIIISVIMLMAPLVLAYFPILSFLPDRYQLIAGFLWYLITVAYIMESFLDWFFNVCVLTNETVFDVDFTNLIYREISEADLDHIQDVTVRMGGVIRTMFDYGDVYIQTAGEVPRIEFEAIPHPDRVSKILREYMFKEEARSEGRAI